MSMTPPKSLMTAVGVKNKPSAMIFRLSSMLMNITNTYSAICMGERQVNLQGHASSRSMSPSSCCTLTIWQSYLQGWGMHDSPEGGLEHHGDAGADGDDNHDPVQVGDKSQQVTAKEQRN